MIIFLSKFHFLLYTKFVLNKFNSIQYKEDETFDHIVNCLHDDKIDPSVIYIVEDEVTYEMKLQLILIASRVSSFIDEFK